jgi:protein-disulfide isomerase
MPGMPKKSTKNLFDEVPLVEEPLIAPEYVAEPVITESAPAEMFSFKASHFYAIITVFAFAAGVILGYVVWGLNPSGAVSNSKTAAQAGGPVVEAPVTQQAQFTRYKVESEGFPSIGPADAPITIIEFSDYQCPFCRRWHQEVYQPLLNAYPGKIKLVYRNLPLTSLHPDAQSAAEAAMCAGEQNSYWPFHEKLFSSDALNKNVYMQYAQEIGLDTTSFEACITNHKYAAAIKSDSDFALNLGVSSTPTFFINGLAIVGAQPLNIFQQIIDKELAGEIPQ